MFIVFTFAFGNLMPLLEFSESVSPGFGNMKQTSFKENLVYLPPPYYTIISILHVS